MNLDFKRIREVLILNEYHVKNLEIELYGRTYLRTIEEDNKMKVELESKYEVGDKVYYFDVFDKRIKQGIIEKIKFDHYGFTYLLMVGNITTGWHEEKYLQNTIDK